jgi:predicted RNA-binding protein with PIN domain
MVHYVIDGYNYMKRTAGGDGEGPDDLEGQRRRALERLARLRGGRVRMTVVFDAYNSFSPGRQRDHYRGIDVLFSRERETADAVIIGWIREKKAGMIVVTSDRAILDEAKRCGVPFLTPLGLEQHAVMERGTDEGSGDGEEVRRDKRGNPRKLPKKLRRVVRTLKKT